MPFDTLWANHPTVKGEGSILDRKVYDNQCAINLSAALMRSGFDMKSYGGVKSWEKDKPRYPIRAQELADWLGLGTKVNSRRETFGPEEAFGNVKDKRGAAGRTGIIFIQDYWGAGRQGDHIDLWNRNRLTDPTSRARIGLRLSSWLPSSMVGSDMFRARAVWFWPIL